MTRRPYDSQAWRRQRANYARIVDSVGHPCARGAGCFYSGWIYPGQLWDLGHVDGTEEIAGPEHRRCNRATAGRRAARLRRELKRRSRIWGRVW